VKREEEERVVEKKKKVCINGMLALIQMTVFTIGAGESLLISVLICVRSNHKPFVL